MEHTINYNSKSGKYIDPTPTSSSLGKTDTEIMDGQAGVATGLQI